MLPPELAVSISPKAANTNPERSASAGRNRGHAGPLPVRVLRWRHEPDQQSPPARRSRSHRLCAVSRRRLAISSLATSLFRLENKTKQRDDNQHTTPFHGDTVSRAVTQRLPVRGTLPPAATERPGLLFNRFGFVLYEFRGWILL